jgi:hypothetical protein
LDLALGQVPSDFCPFVALGFFTAALRFFHTRRSASAVAVSRIPYRLKTSLRILAPSTLLSFSEGSFLNCVIVTSRLSKNALHGSHPSRCSSSFSHRESSEVFRDWGLAFAAVLVLIYVLVVGWFKSFKTSLALMAPIPLTLVGILPAHAAMGAFFTATSVIGFIAGAGIIVRNSIILVDFI